MILDGGCLASYCANVSPPQRGGAVPVVLREVDRNGKTIPRGPTIRSPPIVWIFDTYCDKTPVTLIILLRTQNEKVKSVSCLLILIHNLQLNQSPSVASRVTLILFLNAAWTICQIVLVAKEYPSILQRVALFDHHKIPRIHSQPTLSLETSSLFSVFANSSSISGILLPNKISHVFSWVISQVY